MLAHPPAKGGIAGGALFKRFSGNYLADLPLQVVANDTPHKTIFSDIYSDTVNHNKQLLIPGNRAWNLTRAHSSYIVDLAIAANL
jgi:hypothetical protein